MKLLRVGQKGSEKPAVLDKDGKIRDISSHVKDLNPDHLNFETISKLQNTDLSSLPELSSSDRIGSCITKPGKFIAIGLNYSDHAAETGADVPSEPIVFMKATSCIVGPNDLAYTSLALAPHTDNPYRNPVPCIQLLHCIESKVSGGLSTLVDGYTVTEDLKNEYPEFYKILTEVKVRFRFIDKEVILETISPLIELNDDNSFKQVRFSPRLDYVPILEKEKLDLYYQARKKISEMYNSDKYRIEFKLEPKDLMMMDNHRLLHGRTAYETKEGERFLQGCYIDYDSTEGKLRHLKRKFNL